MAKYKLLLPKMGESVAEATIIKWNKNIGDTVDMDEAVMEIATDKVDSEVPSPVKGILILKLCNENDIVQVGSLIAIIETDEPEEIEAEILTTPASTFEEVTPQHTFEETPAPPQVPFVEQIQTSVTPPQATPSISSSAPLRFYSPLVKNIALQEGISADELDHIPGTGAEGRLTKDDLLLYIRQGKPFQGGVKPAEPEVKGEPVFLMQESYDHPVQNTPEEEPLHHDSSNDGEQPMASHEHLRTEDGVQADEHEELFEMQDKELFAEQHSVGDAPVEEITHPEPVSAPEAEPPSEPIKPVEAPKSTLTEPHRKPKTLDGTGDEIIEMDRMRRLIAEHMIASVQTSPHVTSFVEADVTNLVLWREKIKKDFEKREGEKITYTPIFIEAVTRAIKDFPMVNVQVKGTQIVKKKDINIGMAAALPSGNLIVPVIRNADELNIIGLTKAVNDLAGRARNNKLQPDEVQGGTFTITNVGTFGNLMGTPIINQPQVAILALGAIKKKPAVVETESGDMIAIRHMMFLSLSYDHRVVDGALGGSFLRRIADYLEAWEINREV